MNSFSWNSEREAHTVLPLFHKYWKHHEIFKHARIHAHTNISLESDIGFHFKEQLKRHPIKRMCITHVPHQLSEDSTNFSSYANKALRVKWANTFPAKIADYLKVMAAVVFSSIRHPLCSIRINYIHFLSRSVSSELLCPYQSNCN